MPKAKIAAPKTNGDHDVEYWSPHDLTPYDRNANKHPPEQVALIIKSIEEFGFTIPILADEKGMILAGMGRQMAAIEMDLSSVPVIVRRGLSPAQKRAYVMADNQIARTSEFDFDIIASEMKALASEYPEFNLGVIGFAAADVKKFLDPLFGEQHPDTGKLLEILRVSFDDPTHSVKHGDVWDCNDHCVMCLDLFTEWEIWQRELTAGTVFLPYAGPLVLLSERAKTHRMLIVNPQEYICGMILDKFNEAKLGKPTKRK